jgi:hypothetical protein
MSPASAWVDIDPLLMVKAVPVVCDAEIPPEATYWRAEKNPLAPFDKTDVPAACVIAPLVLITVNL